MGGGTPYSIVAFHSYGKKHGLTQLQGRHKDNSGSCSGQNIRMDHART